MKIIKIHALAWFDSKIISYNDAYISFSGDGIQWFRGSEYLKIRKSHIGKTNISITINTLMTSEKYRYSDSMLDSEWM